MCIKDTENKVGRCSVEIYSTKEAKIVKNVIFLKRIFRSAVHKQRFIKYVEICSPNIITMLKWIILILHGVAGIHLLTNTTCTEYVLNFTTCVLSAIHMSTIIAHSLHMLRMATSWKHFSLCFRNAVDYRERCMIPVWL